MVIGFFANSGNSKTKRTKTHIISEKTWEPICGSQVDPEADMQQVSRGIFFTAIECEHCRKLLDELDLPKPDVPPDPYWPAVQMHKVIYDVLNNEVTEQTIQAAQRLTRANWIQALANGNPVMMGALNEEVKSMLLEEQNERFLNG